MNIKLYISVIIFSCIAYSGLFAMPIWLGALQDTLDISSITIGYIGSLQLACATISAYVLSNYLDRISLIQVIHVALLCVVGANLASFVMTDMTGLFLVRGVSGIGEGMLLAGLNAAISKHENHARLFALSQTSLAGFGIVLFATVPMLVKNFSGLSIFIVIAAVGVAAFIFRSVFQPGSADSPSQQSDGMTPDTITLSRKLLPLLALFFIFIGCQGSWAFMERMGHGSGLQLDQIGFYLIIGQLLGLLSPSIAHFTGRTLAIVPAVIIGLCVSLTAILLASQGLGAEFYMVAAAMFQFGTLFIVTSFFIWLTKMDPLGRIVAAAPSTINAGSALGPGLMGYLIAQHEGFMAIGWASVALYGIAVMLICLVWFRKKEA